MTAETVRADLLRQQERLHRVIESISGQLELGTLLTLIVRQACELIGAGSGTIALYDEERNLLRTEAAHCMPPSEHGAEMGPGVGLAGRVLQTREAAVLSRYGDLDHPTLPELLDHAVIGMPIFWRERLIGFMGIGAEPPRCFNAGDVEMLALFARHAAIAIENARHYEAEKRRTNRFAAINRISAQINSTLSLGQQLQTTIDSLYENFRYAHLAIGLIDPDEPETLVLNAQTGDPSIRMPEGYRQGIAQGLLGIAARERRLVLRANVHAEPNYIPVPGGEQIVCELAIPILCGDRLLGLLNIESATRIAADEAADLSIVADQLGAAIDNAQSFAAAERRAARIETINRIGQLITSSLDLGQTLQNAVEALHHHLDFNSVGLFMVDPVDPQILVLRASSNADAGQIRPDYRQRLNQGIIGAVAQSRQRIHLADVHADPRYVPIPGSRMRSEVAAPVVAGDQLLGVLNIESDRVIGEEDATGIDIVAGQLGVAIYNAQLFARTQQALAETQLLYETVHRISAALSIDEVIAAYLEQVAARGRYACTVALYEVDAEGHRVARITYGSWSPQGGLSLATERTAYQPDTLDPPLDAGQTVAIADVHADPRVPQSLRALQAKDGRPALAFIPLLAHGQRIGVIVLSSVAVIEWPESELRLYQVTAAHLAATIENRRQQMLLSGREQQVAVLEERQRLARDLHDSVTQLVFSVTLIAQSISPAWRRDPAEGERRINRLLELSQAALGELRALLAELRPPDASESAAVDGRLPDLLLLQRDGLEGALRRRMGELADEGLLVELDAAGYPPAGQRPPPAYEETLYRVGQEALNNVQKHAYARRVQMRLGAHGERLWLRVSDDGGGFDVQAAAALPLEARGGMGLRTMRERVAALRGALRVTSTPGAGTTVEVELRQPARAAP